MEDNTNNAANVFTQAMNDNFQKIAELSMSSVKPIMENLLNSYSDMGKSVLEKGVPAIKIPQFKLQSDDCCAPKVKCPPHCISTISRKAMEGERIIVPFLVKNTCSTTKTYKVGVRELKNLDGTLAPTQPVLDKDSITLDPGRSEMVRMGISIHGYTNGSTYNTEIVLREKEINQNICFTLKVDTCNVPVVEPISEQKYKLRWQDWKSHFYCEPPKRIISTTDDKNNPIPTT